MHAHTNVNSPVFYAFLLERPQPIIYTTSQYMPSHFQFNILWLAAHLDAAESV